ncbi:site-specific integrase, partial [Actinophytocola sp.]|uniref:site-specific integrase n=1 Tax=Actinophytocola sp. TaxID=1872138 RepID=UPI002D808F2E
DLDTALLELADTRVVVAGQAEESDGKTESGRRTISLDPVTVDYLRRHVARLDDERRAFGPDYRNGGHLMCHPDGSPIHPETITRRFNRLVDQAGVPRIRLHDVRHTYATVSLDNGVDPKIVADRIGHANMAYTLSIYTHRSTGLDRSAAEKVANVIFGRTSTAPTTVDG